MLRIIKERNRETKQLIIKYMHDGVEINEQEYNRLLAEKAEQILRNKKNASVSILRNKRSAVFRAFDVYKTNVKYGIEQDTNREEILVWYQQCLDLNEQAINNPPLEIKRYLVAVR